MDSIHSAKDRTEARESNHLSRSLPNSLNHNCKSRNIKSSRLPLVIIYYNYQNYSSNSLATHYHISPAVPLRYPFQTVYFLASPAVPSLPVVSVPGEPMFAAALVEVCLALSFLVLCPGCGFDVIDKASRGRCCRLLPDLR